MVLIARRVLILLLCVGLLATQLHKACGLRSSNLALRQSQEDHRIMLKNQRALNAVNTEVTNTMTNAAHVNNRFDPNQSSKRRVRRGSDPIHNRDMIVKLLWRSSKEPGEPASSMLPAEVTERTV